jgi:ribosomal 50S subunit-associated protein YjgA (DUF615 family)
MVKKNKSRKKISNRRKNTLIRKLVRKQLLDITYIFKNIDIDPLENILSNIKITNQHTSNHLN